MGQGMHDLDQQMGSPDAPLSMRATREEGRVALRSVKPTTSMNAHVTAGWYCEGKEKQVGCGV